MENIEYECKRTKTYRYTLRGWAIVYLAIAFGLYKGYKAVSSQGVKLILLAMAVAFIATAISYVKKSFGLSSYTLTYVLSDEDMTLKGKGKEIKVPYSDIKKLTIKKVAEDMDYYMLHFETDKLNITSHIENSGDTAMKIFETIDAKSDIEGQDITGL